MTFDIDSASPGEVEREAARRLARRARGLPLDGDSPRAPAPASEALSDDPARFFIPWSLLCSDNQKYAPALRNKKPVMILTERYRNCKRGQAIIAAQAMHGRAVLVGRVSLQATLHEPQRGRADPTNYAKCVQDAMQKIVYQNDRQIDGSHWVRGSANVDRPGLNVAIVPIVEEGHEHP